MKTVNFECFKIAPMLPLSLITSAFGLEKPLSWENSVVIKGINIENILKKKSYSKQVYIYQYGCVTFVNFNYNEIAALLKSLKAIEDKIDYESFAKYHESHLLKVSKNNTVKLWADDTSPKTYDEGIIPIISEILAKSTALHRVESAASSLLDESENYINNMQKGKLRVSSKKHMNIYLRILRFEYESISSIKIFDRSPSSEHKLRYRKIYDELTNYYEIYDRFGLLEKKVNELRNITKIYSSLSFKSQEYRLLLFEIFLLALFPIYYFTHSILEKIIK